MLTTEGSYISKLTNSSVPYLIHKPKNYDPSKNYPLIISLTGDGEKTYKGIGALRGSGINNAIINKGLEIPFIVFSPQTAWAGYDVIGENNDYKPGQFAAEAVDEAAKISAVDGKKVYIAGLSMGGVSVYLALAYFPEKFAAGVCIASWACDIQEAKKIKGGIWHAQFDNDSVPGRPDYAIDFLKQTNSKDARYTIISGYGHGLWEEIYENRWMSMAISRDYPGSTKPTSIYDWFLQFSTDGTVTPPVTPPVEPPVTPPTEPTDPTPTNSNMTIKDSTGKVLLGKIEAENYTSTNKTGNFTETTTDTGGGKNVGWSNVNDYLDYAINIPVDGTYQIDLRLATVKDAQIKVSSGNSSNVVTALNTGGWQNWKTVSTQLKLVAGPQTIRLTAITDGFNINWLNVSLYSLTISGFIITE